MKIAYLTSRYPDVSHTFIVREVRALRERGEEVLTFSVRRPRPENILGPEAEQEAASTRWLVPTAAGPLLWAALWAMATRPIRAMRTLAQAIFGGGMTLAQRFKWFCYFGEALLLAHWLATEQFEHLHCHFGNSGSGTGMLAARLAGIPFSMTCHGSELNEITHHRLTEKVAQAAFVACVSQYGKSQLMSASDPSHWHKLHVVRCGIPPAEEDGGKPSPTPDSRGLTSPNCSDGAFQILCVARLSPEKGHLVLLDALAELRDRGVDFHCRLAGDGRLRPKIEVRARQLGLSSLLTLTGSRTPEQVARLYRTADVVVLASFSEGVPVSLMEAMSHGIPVVATRVGGVPELVKDGHSGLLVSPGDAVALKDALLRVLEDPSSAAFLAENAVRRALTWADIDASARRLIDLLQAVTRNHPRNKTISFSRAVPCPSGLHPQDS